MEINTLNTSAVKSQYTDIAGTISHYNGLLFRDLTADQADTEGALAIGRNSKFGSGSHGYDVAASGVLGGESVFIGKYENPNGYPSLLLGGTVSSESTNTRVHAGNIVMKLSNQQIYEQNTFQFEYTNNLLFVNDNIVDSFFTEAKKQVLYTSGLLAQGSSKTIGLSTLMRTDQLNLEEYKCENIKTDINLLILNLECSPSDSVTIGELYFSDAIMDYDTIVINIPVTKITFTGGAFIYNGTIINTSLPSIYEGNQLIQNLASKLVFNLPIASEVNLSHYGLIGSLIAPNALITTAGGSINGMLIADSLLQQGGMELHAFKMSMGDKLWELSSDPPVGSVQIVKTDLLNPKITLQGAIFSLFRFINETNQYQLVSSGLTTLEGGTLLIEDLLPGSYQLIETQPPEGYGLPENAETRFDMKINEEGEILKMDIIYISNTLLAGDVRFIKADSGNREITLQGAVFSLYMLNAETMVYDVVSTGLTTSENGTLLIEGLLPGNYKLVETQAPPKYYLPDNGETLFTISLDENGEITELEPIYILNTLLGSIQVIKIDSEDEEITLAGAVFSLYKYNEKTSEYDVIITGLTTGEDGSLFIENLDPGNYKLIETTAPNGYKLPDDPETFFTIEL